MPTYGGFSPYPRRFGGGRRRLQDVLDTLNADRGSTFNTENRETAVYAENMALARGLDAAWGTNERLGSLWDPRRMSMDIVARWEKMLSLAPRADDSAVTRRQRLVEAFARFGKPSIGYQLYDRLAEELGDAFVAAEYIDIDSANIQVPDGSYPWGAVGTSPWSSTVAHVLVRLQKPTGWTEGQFYKAAARVAQVLEPELPVWTTFSWYRPGDVSSSVGGISAVGFYLDQPANLDNQVLGS